MRALKNEKILFFISTNEVDLDWVDSDIPLLNFRGGSPARDLYSLSKCDYIIGPPSTFSRWASLVGHVPIHLIWDKNKPILKESFSPMLYLDEREDGLVYP